MIERRGTVVAVRRDRAAVRLGSAGCDACAGGRGCGLRAFARQHGRVPILRARCDLAASAGDEVLVGVPAGALLAACAASLGLPLAGLLGGGAVAAALHAGAEGPTLAGGLLGFFTGIACARGAGTGLRASLRPEVSRRASRPGMAAPGDFP